MTTRCTLLAALAAALLLLALACRGSAGSAPEPLAAQAVEARGPTAPAGAAHDVMESAFCARCHPDIYAEHEQSTHGRAFTDEEVRLATARFAHQDCIICHTPRPIFETGVGLNPKRRHYGLTEGNTCMTCHWRPDYDYAGFQGGAQCRTAFHPDAGTVEACASCHRNHGTPYQWAKSPTGKATGRVCIDCHMAEVERPVAVGGPLREVRTHVFPGSRNARHVARAYDYEARIEGNAVLVTLKNKGAGHNFPTELKQRSVESLVVVKDLEGREIARSRMVFRDPYKRPYGLELPVNTQIPGGETRTHRVPIGVATGTVECRLFFKLFFPIDDYHPELARTLEARSLAFAGLTPSSEPVESEPSLAVVAPEGIPPELASPANLVDFAHPAIGTVLVDVPSGSTAEDVQRLIELFQFPVPEANARARARLVEIGPPAVPALVRALGSWDNKTSNQAMQVLEAIDAPARAPVEAALDDAELYVRLHACELVVRRAWSGPDVEAALARGLASASALDRASAAVAVGELDLGDRAPELERLLGDADPDVVRASALALAQLGTRAAVPALLEAFERAFYDETRRDLALSLARLGSVAGIPALLAGLDQRDDLLRESSFEAFFSVTGVHLGFDPLAPRPERLEALAALQAWWAGAASPERLLAPPLPADRSLAARAWRLVGDLGGSDLSASTPEKDARIEAELVGMGEVALDALVRGLKYPPGFADKRAALCRILGRVGSPRAAPALAATLRDPVVSVAAWAAWALERAGDAATSAALARYERRLRSLADAGALPPEAGPFDRLLAQAARTRMVHGDERARPTLAALLLSADVEALTLAIESLVQRYGEDRGYDPQAGEAERRAAAARWMD
jgi:HEAT repeat protein